MYCPNCSQFIEENDLEFSFSEGSDFSYDEDCMSDGSDDAMLDLRSPQKRTRQQAGLSHSDDNDRPRKKLSPAPSLDVMEVDEPDFTLSINNKF